MQLDTLLLPIVDDLPCGEDMTFSAEFDKIQALRKSDDPTLDQGAWVRDLKVADWPAVQRLTTELLTKRTKDLRVAGWLAEALAKNTGFSGLATGLRLSQRLCDLYWDQVHPLPEDGDHEQRLGNLIWLLSQTRQLGAEIAIVGLENAQFGRQSIELARSRAALPHDHDASEQQSALSTLEQINKAIQATTREHLASVHEQTQDSLQALAQLQNTIDDRLGNDGPGFVEARQSLQDTLHLINRLRQERGFQTASPIADQAAPTSAPSEPLPHTAMGTITSRAHALNQLRLVAEYFRKTEPHSPVAYLADKAAKWGETPLHDWLRTVIKDQGALGHIEELLGINPVITP